MNTRFSKSILALAAASLLGTAGVSAGGPGDGSCDGDGACTGTGAGKTGKIQAQRRGGPADRMARMANRLGLTLEQQKGALDLFSLQAQDRQQLRSQMLDRFGDELCAMRDQHRAEFRALLTEDQLAAHDAMLRQRDRARSADRGGIGPLDCPKDD